MCPENESRGENLNPFTIFFTGFSRLPANAIGPNSSGVLSVEIEVDPYDMRIVDASCNCLPGLAEKMLVSVIVGNRITSGIDSAVEQIRQRYISSIQRAIIAALEDIKRHFEEYEKDKAKE